MLLDREPVRMVGVYPSSGRKSSSELAIDVPSIAWQLFEERNCKL
jgi:hypothetical protein